MFSRSNRLVPYVVGLATIDRQLVASNTGTGTIINNKGIVLTASHVLQSASGESLVGINLIGKPPVCKSFAYREICRFPEHDLVIVQFDGLHLNTIRKPPQFLFRDLEYGHQVGSFGYPIPEVEISHPPNLDGPLVSVTMTLRFKSYFVASRFPGTPSVFYSLDSFAYGGHSGGPVFIWNGKICAVMVRTNLEPRNRYEVSFCEAVALSNIKSDLQSILASYSSD